LGWATASEKGGSGAYQLFQHGEMYWTGAANRIYVLYGRDNQSTYPSPTGTIYRYDVFSDTYAP
jgi:uncharacterized protein with LGFP repeats